MPRIPVSRTSAPSRNKRPPAVCHCGVAASGHGLCPAHWAKAYREGTLPHSSGKAAKQPRRLTGEEKAGILKDIKTGPTRNVAAAHGVAINTVRRIARAAGGVRSLKEETGPGKSGNRHGRFCGRGMRFAGHGAAAIAALEEDGCRWPVGDTREEGFHFCGAKQIAGKSYCAHHMAKAFTPRGRQDDEV